MAFSILSYSVSVKVTPARSSLFRPYYVRTHIIIKSHYLCIFVLMGSSLPQAYPVNVVL